MVLVLMLACGIATSGGVDSGGGDSGPGGVAVFSAESLAWHDLTVGYSATQTLDVTNGGGGDLDITEAAIVTDPSGVFSVALEPFTLGPGDLGSIVVTALLMEDAPATGELRVRTSDPAAASTLFPLTAD